MLHSLVDSARLIYKIPSIIIRTIRAYFIQIFLTFAVDIIQGLTILLHTYVT